VTFYITNFYCLFMISFFFLFIRLFCVSVSLMPFPLFLFGFFYCPSFSPFFLTFVFMFFGSCWFHLYPTPACLGLKGLVVVVVVDGPENKNKKI
jgi:hypothetical protein